MGNTITYSDTNEVVKMKLHTSLMKYYNKKINNKLIIQEYGYIELENKIPIKHSQYYFQINYNTYIFNNMDDVYKVLNDINKPYIVLYCGADKNEFYHNNYYTANVLKIIFLEEDCKLCIPHYYEKVN